MTRAELEERKRQFDAWEAKWLLRWRISHWLTLVLTLGGLPFIFVSDRGWLVVPASWLAACVTNWYWGKSYATLIAGTEAWIEEMRIYASARPERREETTH